MVAAMRYMALSINISTRMAPACEDDIEEEEDEEEEEEDEDEKEEEREDREDREEEENDAAWWREESPLKAAGVAAAEDRSALESWPSRACVCG